MTNTAARRALLSRTIVVFVDYPAAFVFHRAFCYIVVVLRWVWCSSIIGLIVLCFEFTAGYENNLK